MGTLPQDNTKTPERDQCGTPSYALEPLLPYLDALQTKLGHQPIIWESAAGDGLLASYLRNAWFATTESDILTGTDYFKTFDYAYHAEVTNVPFSCKIKWLEKACEADKPFALLMPSNTRFTAGGSTLVRKYGIQLLSPIQRIDYKMPELGWGDGVKDSTSQFHSSWFCKGLDLESSIVDVDIVKSTKRLNLLRSGWVPRLGITEYDQYLLDKPVKVRGAKS